MNKQQTLIAKMVAAAITTTIASQAFGAAFQLNYQSIPVASMGFAGRASNINDATTIGTNPAGMSMLDSKSVSAGFAVVDPSSSISNANTTYTTPAGTKIPVSGTTEGDMGQTAFIPSAYIAFPSAYDSLSAGLGVYGSFGAHSQYENTFKGIMFADETVVKVSTIQPTVSYKVNDRFSVGGGITINKAKGILTSSTGNPALRGTLTNESYESRLDADDMGYGVNLGLMYKITPEMRLGFAYRSRVEYDLSGDASVTLPLPVSATSFRSYSSSGSGNLSIKTPDIVDLGLNYDVSPELSVAGTISWTGWSVLDTLKPTTDLTGPTAAITNALQNPQAETLDYKDTWLFGIGANYKFNPKLIIRGGYAYDTSPTDVNASARLPSSDRNVITVGLGYRPTPVIGFDFMYGYVHEGDADVNATKSSSGTYNYTGTYQNRYNLYGMQMNYKF